MWLGLGLFRGWIGSTHVEQLFEGDEVVKVIGLGEGWCQFSLVNEGGADSECTGELKAGDFFGDFVDDCGVDSLPNFHLDQVKCGWGADEEIDLAGFFSLGGILEKRSIIEDGGRG